MTKNNSVEVLLDLIEPFMEGLGFKRKSKLSFIRKNTECNFKYVISVRKPRYADDPNEMYINPCLHVYYPVIEKYLQKISKKTNAKGFPTIGGSLGLFRENGHSEEVPINSNSSLSHICENLQKDIREIGVAFWQNFSTHKKVLESIQKGLYWGSNTEQWKYRKLLFIAKVKGKNFIERYLDKKSWMFKEHKISDLRECLFEFIDEN